MGEPTPEQIANAPLVDDADTIMATTTAPSGMSTIVHAYLLYNL